MKTSKFKKLVKVNSLIIGSIIAVDLLVLNNHHNPENDTHVRRVAASHRMKQTPMSKLNTIQADEEQEFSGK